MNTGIHDDRCASHKGLPCNCAAAALAPKPPPAEPPRSAASLGPVQAASGPDLVAILADYFTGPDLNLCSLAMAAYEDTTARRRAERFFKARDAFGIPREVDIPNHARDHIIHALAKFNVGH